VTAVAYRIYDLPWTPSPADERRVRRVLGAALGLFIGFGIVIPLLPERERSQVVAPAIPERVVEFLLERPKPPPPPEPKVELPRPQPKPEVAPRVERPRPVPAPVAEAPPRPDPRKKAAESGLLALSDQLAELRSLDVEPSAPTKSRWPCRRNARSAASRSSSCATVRAAWPGSNRWSRSRPRRAGSPTNPPIRSSPLSGSMASRSSG
jgi:outer membrane biosynthesis protein TonB